MPTRATAAPSAHPIHPLAPKDRRLVDRLRAICLALPDANERVSHGEATWFAGRGKSFAMTDNHHHGSTHLSVWLPQPPDIQASLIESDPARFFRPALRRPARLGGRRPRHRPGLGHGAHAGDRSLPARRGKEAARPPGKL